MELTRRDALVALGALGTTAAAVGTARQGIFEDLDDETMTTRLHAVAEAIYPSEIDVEESFISTFVVGRLNDREEYVREQADALEHLETQARRNTGRSLADLDPSGRQTVLRRMGVHNAHPNPDGTREEHVRYYVVNDLQYALFSSPTGGELVGCENPPGYPGGREAYQRGPQE